MREIPGKKEAGWVPETEWVRGSGTHKGTCITAEMAGRVHLFMYFTQKHHNELQF